MKEGETFKLLAVRSQPLQATLHMYLFVAKYLKLMIELCEFSVDDLHSCVRCGLTNIFTYFSWCS